MMYANRSPIILSALLLISLMLNGCASVLTALGSDPIEEDPGKRTFASQVRDESIETKALVNIRAADEQLKTSKLIVVAYNGYVLLAGEVPSPALKDTAADIVRQIEGVRRIYNELTIGPNSSSEADANDVWLTTKVKTTLLTSSETPALRVKVVTEDGVVYLMGLLTPEEADRVANKVANIIGVKRVVKLFELI